MDQFMLEKLIGEGGSSKVYLATHLETNVKVAIKVLKNDKEFTKVKGAQIVEDEHKIMKTIEGHPNVLKSYFSNSAGILKSGFESKEVMYNAIELADNGSMSKIIRNTGGLDEVWSKFYFLQIWHAVAHIHSFGIAHMDIKLENILLDEFFNAKVADLGISLYVSESNGMTHRVRGTKWYMAPEISHLLPSETYDAYKSDIYSLGMWLYIMLFGEYPIKDNYETCSKFDSETIGWITGLKISPEIKKKWESTSIELQDLLGSMLSMDPDDRPSLVDIFKSDWLKDMYDWEISQEVFEEMKIRKQFIIENSYSSISGYSKFNN